MKDFKVMIVEDDFRVADINKSVTEEVKGFTVVKISKTSREAFDFIKTDSPDLAIVDVYLPDYSGIELIKKIRKNDYPVDIILITAAHDAETVESSMRYGVFDYIIKPLSFSRFKESLENYKKYKSAVSTTAEYTQERINEMVSHNMLSSGPMTAENILPKGITPFTLEKIKKAVSECMISFTINDVIANIKLSKITVRRYLEFLTETGLISKTYRYEKVGRPTVIYTKNS